jgi:hypothetical protein
MYARAKEKGNNNDKLEVDALRLAKDTAIEIIDMITNNQSFVDAAWEVAYNQDCRHQLQQMNKNLNTSQEDGIEKEKRKPIL